MTDQDIIIAIEKDGLGRMKDCNISTYAKRKAIWSDIGSFIGCKWTTVQNARRKGLGKSAGKLLKIYAKEKGVIK